MEREQLLGPIEADLRAVEEEIQRLIRTPISLIGDVANHTLNAGGKRLRPALTLLSARAVGEVPPQVITLASLVELTHTATLIHDDVVDHTETRRGRPTANLLWGNVATVLVGDYIYSQVVFVLSHDEFKPFMYTLARATNLMCAGEILEIELCRKVDASEEDYQRLIQCKTAELISAAAQLGVLGAGGNGAQVKALGEYGLNVGMAFQIVDDMLDVTGDAQRLGKPVGSDFREGKVTLPYIRTLQVAAPDDCRRLRDLILLENPTPDAVEAALALVRRYDGLPYSQRLARAYADAAIRSLHALPPSPVREALKGVVEFVVTRDR